MATDKLVNPPSGPLTGVRVLDFGTFVAGSYHAVVMGDMGADVIKVEPLDGDPARNIGPFVAGESRVFVGWNRNKRGLAVELLSEAGVKIIRDLVREADVVTANFRPGIVDKLGLDYESLSAINPRLIYCSSTGFGTKGPLRDRPAFDSVFQTMGGTVSANALLAGKETLAAPIFIDFHTALLGLGGILAALYHREKTGQGQKVETSLLQGAMSVMSANYCQPLEAEEEGTGGAAPYSLFETSDGFILIAALIHKHWLRLCDLLGRPDLPKDERFIGVVHRMNNKDALTDIMQSVTRTKTAAEWEELFVAEDVPCAIVLSAPEFFDHPQVEAVGMCPVIEHSTIGPMRVYGVPIEFEKTPGGIQRSAPRLGEHNDEILRDLGYDDERIKGLKSDGVIPE